MDLNVTRTFSKTYTNFKSKLTKEEYKKRLTKYITDGIPVIPSEYRYRQIVSVGGSRSSKSWSILQLLLVELKTRKNIKITVWRNIKKVCRDTVLEDFQNILRADAFLSSQFKYNKQDGEFTYISTGSRIVFEGADNVGKVLGGAQDISFFNEVSEFNKEVYLQITQRTSDRIFCDYNPSKDFWLESYRFDEETCFIHSTFKDNAYCPPRIVKQLLSYEPWETGSYHIEDGVIIYNGNPISVSNQPPPHIENMKKKTGSEFMWMVYGLGLQAEKPNRIYTGWRQISLEVFEAMNYKSFFGLDFGSSSPTACVEVKYDGNGAFYVCPRFYKPLNNLDTTLSTSIEIGIPQIVKGKSWVVCDSAKDSYIKSLKQAGFIAMGAVKGGGSVEFGITLVQGVTIYFVMTEEFLTEYNSYSWATDRYDKALDSPLKENDHYMDALRYIITYLIKYLGIKV